MTRRHGGFGQAACAAQQQALGQAQAAQAQAASQAAFDGGMSLAAANQQLQSAAQALQSCQGGSSVSDTLKTAAPIVGSLASLGVGIASMFIKPPAPAYPTAYPQQIAQPVQNNNTVIIAVVAGVVLLVIVVLMMGKK